LPSWRDDCTNREAKRRHSKVKRDFTRRKEGPFLSRAHLLMPITGVGAEMAKAETRDVQKKNNCCVVFLESLLDQKTREKTSVHDLFGERFTSDLGRVKRATRSGA